MSGFADLAANIGELAGLPSRISKRVADGIDKLLNDQFDAETDPYGNAWEPLLPQTVKRKKGDSRILRRTDNLVARTTAVASAGSGVELVSEDYGGVHQVGYVNMVARPILPDGAELPEEWQDIIDGEFEDAMKKADF